jgi:hypothetical protein
MVVTEYKLYIGVCDVNRKHTSLTHTRILVLSQPGRLVAEIQRFQRAAREESC